MSITAEKLLARIVYDGGLYNQAISENPQSGLAGMLKSKFDETMKEAEAHVKAQAAKKAEAANE